jgi:hypothetical protein
MKIHPKTFNNFVGIKELNFERFVLNSILYDNIDKHHFNSLEFKNLPNLEIINFPKLYYHGTNANEGGLFNNLPKLKKIVFGYIFPIWNKFLFKNLPNLKDVYMLRGSNYYIGGQEGQ